MNRNESHQPQPMPRAAVWLSLAAAPTFLIMALATRILDAAPSDILCTAIHGAPPLCGMTTMYLLMGVFHSAPWLKMLARGANQCSRNARGESWHPSLASLLLCIFGRRVRT